MIDWNLAATYLLLGTAALCVIVPPLGDATRPGELRVRRTSVYARRAAVTPLGWGVLMGVAVVLGVALR